MKNVILILLPVLFIACAKPDSSNLEEVKGREVEVENENLRKKAEVLEGDLARRQRLFSALKGTFEGTFTTGTKKFKKRITLVPSLPPYNAGRTRTLEEITSDLNNLYFTIQTTILNAENNSVVAGCILSQVRPDYDGGAVNAASENCSNIYLINLYDSLDDSEELPSEKSSVPQMSQELAQKIFLNQLSVVDEVFVEMHPTLTDKTFLMVLKRVQQQ